MNKTEKAFEQGKQDYATGTSCPFTKLELIRAWNQGRSEAEHRANWRCSHCGARAGECTPECKAGCI